jgi:hypothetical protein
MTFAERLADLRDQFHAAKDRHSAEAARHREKFARDRQPQTEHQAQQSEARAKYYGRQLDSSARGKLLYEHDVPLTGGPLDALQGRPVGQIRDARRLPARGRAMTPDATEDVDALRRRLRETKARLKTHGSS